MKTKVFMIESERGWGSKVDEVKELDTREAAVIFAKEYNDKFNPPGPVPDWYIVAEVEK